MRIVSVGEILWDVLGEKEYLGGAPLNFAVHARQLGHEVFLLSAVGDDQRGHRAIDSLRERGVSTEFVRVLGGKNTGTAEVELDSDGKPTFRIVRPAAYDFVEFSAAQLTRIAELQPEWIYFGTLFHMSPRSLALTLELLQSTPSARRFYDVNLRDNNWSLPVVERLSAQSNVVKLSDSEAEFLDGSLNAGGQFGSVEHFCRRWCKQYGCEVVCVTFGERGCAVYRDGEYCEVPGYRVEVADTVGAGDAFAAAFLHGLEEGWEQRRIGDFANAVGALVASRPGATPEWKADECRSMIGPPSRIPL
jgi:fructokinase